MEIAERQDRERVLLALQMQSEVERQSLQQELITLRAGKSSLPSVAPDLAP